MRRSLAAARVIKLLGLKPLAPEGGYFRETYRSRESLAAGRLPARYRSKRALSTTIYFLLTPDTFSAIHRIKSDEVYHFYAGDPVELQLLYPPGKAKRVVLGSDLLRGQRPQFIIPRGVWQGARLVPGGTWSLLGTTVAPGFEYADFELGDRKILLRSHPDRARQITALTRE
jgi:uncharacterized protein